MTEHRPKTNSADADSAVTSSDESSCRARMEAEIQWLSQQRQLALDAAGMGWWHYDPVSNISTLDEGYRRTFGVEDATLPNDEILKRLHPDDLPGVWSKVEAALNPDDPQPYATEFRIFLPDGSMRWIEAHGIASFRGTGNARQACSFVGTVADITYRKETEQKLQKSEARYRELVENANNAIIRWRADGCITYFNEYAQALFGYKSSEVLDRHVSILLPDHESTGGDLTSLVEQIVTHPEDFVSNLNENICKDEKRIWMAWTNKPIYDDEGKVCEILAIGTDVTSQKMAEASLRESEMRFRQIADFMPQLVWTADPSGKVDYYNERRNEFEGFSQKPDGSWKWAPVVHPEEQAATIEAWKTAYQTGAPYEIEHRIKRSDGCFSWFLSRAFPIRNETGEIYKWFGTATDIDAIKQAEKTLEAAKQMAEEANQAKSDFLASVSHEIRTPMTVIMGSVEYLLEKNKNSEIHDALILADTSSKRLYTLLNEILDHSRIEAHRMTLAEGLFNLKDCLNEAISLMNPKAREKGLEVKLSISPSVPEIIYADNYRLGQILINLLGNAIKFTHKGSITVGARRDRRELLLSVSDTGIGIPEKTIEFIFDAFKQADSSSGRTYGGVGLGLSISKGLVELMGGTIQVESTPQEGSVFTFTLPLKTKRPAQ